MMSQSRRDWWRSGPRRGLSHVNQGSQVRPLWKRPADLVVPQSPATTNERGSDLIFASLEDCSIGGMRTESTHMFTNEVRLDQSGRAPVIWFSCKDLQRSGERSLKWSMPRRSDRRGCEGVPSLSEERVLTGSQGLIDTSILEVLRWSGCHSRAYDPSMRALLEKVAEVLTAA